MKVKLENKNINFNLIYKKRKTLKISIEPNGEIKVEAPIIVKDEEVLRIIKSKAKWIINKQEEIKKINDEKIEREAIYGKCYLYLGKYYPLKLTVDKSIKMIYVNLAGENLIVVSNTYDEEKVQLAIKKWYKEKTLERAKERISYYENYFYDKVKDIKVKEQKARWASCTYDNKILFNYRIIMAPSLIFDYIVVHEMCHMKHKNHSKEYWKSVKEILLDYKERKLWLRKNGIKLTL
ncbi:MAG: SprT family zinc-dependent metalloprotease [Clostridium perfringens]|nr:SprT family zinc-dependent metalloprotease [Clostridium perfringens]